MKESPRTGHRSTHGPGVRETDTGELTSAGLGSVVSGKDELVGGRLSADGVVVCRDPPYTRVAIGVSVNVTYGFETDGKEDGEAWYSVADTTF